MNTLNKIANKKAFLGRVLDEYQIKKAQQNNRIFYSLIRLHISFSCTHIIRATKF